MVYHDIAYLIGIFTWKYYIFYYFFRSVFGTKRVITEEIVETDNSKIKSEENPAPSQKVARMSSTSKANPNLVRIQNVIYISKVWEM